MLTASKFSTRTNGGGGGFLRPSDAAAATTVTGIGSLPPASRKSTLSKPFDDLRWPYAVSPLQVYLYGVITVWVLFILYHLITFAIHAVRKRIRRRNGKKRVQSRRQSKDKDDHRPLESHRHQLHTAETVRPSARVAKVPPKSPGYHPSKTSKVKVHRKLAKKIALRSATRQRRKSRREFARSKPRVKKAESVPTSPSYELFQYMNSQPLSNVDGEGRVTEACHSFVAAEKEIADPQSSNDVSPAEISDTTSNTCEEPGQEDANEIENSASSSVKTETRLVLILISSGLYEYTQKAQQKEALDLFNDLQIAHETIDGMDPLQRELRNHLFQVSGVRGKYPQIFTSDDDEHTYLGGYDWLQSMDFEDLRKIVA